MAALKTKAAILEKYRNTEQLISSLN